MQWEILKMNNQTAHNIQNYNKKNKKKHQIDHLLRVLKIYKFKIIQPSDFYDMVGVTINSNDISTIKKSNILNEKLIFDFDETVFDRVINELNIINVSESNRKTSNFSRKINSNQRKKSNKKIENPNKKETKILLLGPRQSGKSTILRTFRYYISDFKFNKKYKLSFKNLIYSQIINQMLICLDYIEILKEEENDDNDDNEYKEYSQDGLSDDGKIAANELKIFTQNNNNNILTQEIAYDIEYLWNEGIIQFIFDSKSKLSIDIEDSSSYFFDEIRRIANPNYIPND
eukprot:20277_1